MKNQSYFGFYLFSITTIIFLSASCFKQAANAADIIGFNDSIISIKNFRKLHTMGMAELIAHPISIQGTVVANDEHDNIYKSICIQDNTGGIMVQFYENDRFIIPLHRVETIKKSSNGGSHWNQKKVGIWVWVGFLKKPKIQELPSNSWTNKPHCSHAMAHLVHRRTLLTLDWAATWLKGSFALCWELQQSTVRWLNWRCPRCSKLRFQLKVR